MVYGARCCSDAGQSRQEQFKSPGISVRVYKPSDLRDGALEGHHHHPIEHPQSTQSTTRRRPILRPGRSHKSQNCCKSLSRTQASFHRVIVHMDHVRYPKCHLQMMSQEFLTRRFHDDKFESRRDSMPLVHSTAASSRTIGRSLGERSLAAQFLFACQTPTKLRPP